MLAASIQTAGRAADAIRADADAAVAGPLRRCIATGTVAPRATLVRFVLGPDGMVVPDVEGRLPGRGLWLSARREAIAKAVKGRLFAKAARARAEAPADLADAVERLLLRRCIDWLGLARRAGQAAAGFEPVREWLQAGRAGLLLEAADGSAGGRAKILALAGTLPVIDIMYAAELGSGLGREHVVHAALAPGRIAGRLKDDAERLRGLRTGASPVVAALSLRDETGTELESGDR